MLIDIPSQGVRVRAHVSGLEIRSEPVVLLHGLGGSKQRDFASLFAMFARSRPVVAVDFTCPAVPGTALHLEQLEEQVRATLDEVLPGRPPAVVAQSLGTAVAVSLASRGYPMSSLVLASGWLTSTRAIRMFNDIWQECALKAPGLLPQVGGLGSLSPSFLDETRPGFLESALCPVEAAFTTAQMRLAANLDLTEAAQSIDTPTLVIAGTEDLLAGRQQAGHLAGAITRAQYTEIESGHLISLEKPAEMLRSVERFLGTLRLLPTPIPARLP